jgi:hypothetical protein
MEAPPRFELGIMALQATALPLGDGAIFLSSFSGARGRT